MDVDVKNLLHSTYLFFYSNDHYRWPIYGFHTVYPIVTNEDGTLEPNGRDQARKGKENDQIYFEEQVPIPDDGQVGINHMEVKRGELHFTCMPLCFQT